MDFKGQVAADLDTFVNVTEFGEVRDIEMDGNVYDVPSVLDDHLRAPNDATGVFVYQALLYCKTTDLPAVPLITSRLVVDKRPGRVIHVDEAMGMLAIRLEWFGS